MPYIKTSHLIIIGLVVCLNACTTMPCYQQAYNKPINWQARQWQLQKIQYWQLRGAIAIKTPQKSLSAYLNWQQFSQHHYQLTLFGPLGIGTIIMHGSQKQFTLQMAKEKIYKARNPEILIQQQLGWNLPVTNLYYWIRGLPAPHLKAKKQLDAYNHLTKLTQQGWHISYLKYAGIHGVDLPTKIYLSTANINLRIIISHWELSRV